MKCKLAYGIIASVIATGIAGAEEASIADAVKALGVEIYGQANVSMDYLDDGAGDGSVYLSDNASRLGFKGSTVINDEVKLIWQMESAVSLDDGDTSDNNKLCNRNSYIGFDTPYGKIITGRNDTPYKTLGIKGDLFLNRIGDYRNILGSVSESFDQRVNNVVMYTSPTSGGVTATVAYVPEDGAVNTEIYSASVIYQQDGLLAGLACEQHGIAIKNAGGDEAQGIRALISYKTGDVQANVIFESLINADATDYNRNSIGAGVAVDMSEKVVLKGQIYATDGDDTEDNAGAVMYVAGVDYKIAKSTTLYAAVALTDNEGSASFAMSGGGGHEDKVTPAAGDDPVGISFGIVHKFSYK